MLRRKESTAFEIFGFFFRRIISTDRENFQDEVSENIQNQKYFEREITY